jgi:predicted site-specific integrase-resolvase
MADKLQDMISLRESGRLLGVAHVTVWRWVKSGKLKGYPISDRLFVSRREVERIMERKKK